MTIDVLPPPPVPTDPVETFDTKAFAFNAALSVFRTQANDMAAEMQMNADVAAAIILAMALPQFSGTSSSSVSIGTGAKTFVTQTGKGWLPGQIVVVTSGANYLKGSVTSYSGANLSLNVTSVNGSGTFGVWDIGLSYDGLSLAKSGLNDDIFGLTGLVGPGLLPVGSVIFHAANTAPSGYLKANGALISRTTYANLFASIGTTFGVGDGSTTFGLPDLRGEFIRGWVDNRVIAGETGRVFGSAQTDQMQGHRHTFTALVAHVGGGTGTTSPSVNSAIFSGTTDNPVTDTVNGTPRTGAETRPRNIALLACIKF